MVKAKEEANKAVKPAKAKVTKPKTAAKTIKKANDDVAVAKKKAAKSTTKKLQEQVETQLIAEAIVEAEQTPETEVSDTIVTKAGKRSSKALKEAEEKQAKEERKTQKVELEAEEATKPKVPHKPARSILERRSKNYRKSAELIEKGKNYNLVNALDLAAKTSSVKFDASIEMHVRLSVDPRQADQNIRGTVVLPSGSGKSLKIAVFADSDDIAKAKAAGADIAAGDEFLQQLDKEVIDFDVLIATPAMMPKLGKYARLLGPKGLMPNPKSGTVTTDVVKAITEAKAGRVEFRVDSTGIVHVAIGKVSFGADKLTKNAQAVLSSIKAAKPASLKAAYVRSIFVSSSMGPSISVEISEL